MAVEDPKGKISRGEEETQMAAHGSGLANWNDRGWVYHRNWGVPYRHGHGKPAIELPKTQRGTLCLTPGAQRIALLFSMALKDRVGA